MMPDLTPEAYRKLARQCCDADPDKCPDALTLWNNIHSLTKEVGKDDSTINTWNTIYGAYCNKTRQSECFYYVT